MSLLFVILVPCSLVGLGVYVAMSRWEISSGPAAYEGGYRPRTTLPRQTFSETWLDWPIPQFQRLHPAALAAISAVLALWIVAWIVLLFVGLSKLHA